MSRYLPLLDQDHPLAKGCVFAFCGWGNRNIEVKNGRVGTVTSVRQSQRYGVTGVKFSGGSYQASGINFGVLNETKALHHNPSTWLIDFQINTAGNCALICQSDANVSSGWNVGKSKNAYFGLTLVRSGYNVFTGVAYPSVGYHSLAITYAGTNNHTGISIYVDGALQTVADYGDGSGDTYDISDPLMVANQRVYDGKAFDGRIFGARIYNRVLSYNEISAFFKDTQAGFIPAAQTTWSFAVSSAGVTLACDGGAVTIAGDSVGTLASKLLSIDSGSVAVSGSDTSLLANRICSIEPGTVTCTGSDVGTLRNTVLSIESGSVGINGQDIAITLGSVSNITVSCDPASVTISGSDVGLLATRMLGCDTGAVTVAGQEAALSVTTGVRVACDPAAVSVSASDTGLIANRILSLDTASTSISGGDTGVFANVAIGLDQGSVEVVSSDADVLRDYVLAIAQGAVYVTGSIVEITPSQVAIIDGQAIINISLKCSTTISPTFSNSSSIIGKLRR